MNLDISWGLMFDTDSTRLGSEDQLLVCEPLSDPEGQINVGRCFASPYYEIGLLISSSNFWLIYLTQKNW